MTMIKILIKKKIPTGKELFQILRCDKSLLSWRAYRAPKDPAFSIY